MQRLGLDSLEMRRLRQDLLFTYKILFNLVSGAADNMFTLTNALYSVRTRGHPYKLYLHNNRIDVRKHFFCERVIRPWNSLPATSDNFSCLSSFKHFISSVDLAEHVSLGFWVLMLLRHHIRVFNLWCPVKNFAIFYCQYVLCYLILCGFLRIKIFIEYFAILCY